MHTDLSELVTVFTQHCKYYTGKQMAKSILFIYRERGACFCFDFVCFQFLEIGILCVVLELVLQARLTSNSEIKGMHHHT